MKLHVQYTGQLRTAMGRPEESIELPEGSDLHGLLEHLFRNREAAVRSHVLTETGQLRRSLLVAINGQAVTADAKSALRHGDVVTFMPPIAGG
jgi:sulfur-carrier protein